MLALTKVAKKAGAKNLLLTAAPQSSAARLAAFMLLYPRANYGQRPGRQVTSVLPMGSAYEGALFVLLEVMVLKLKALAGVSPEAMRSRHTNME